MNIFKSFNLVVVFALIGVVITILFILTPTVFANHCGTGVAHTSDNNCPPLVFPTASGIGLSPSSGPIILFYPVGVPITNIIFPQATGGVPPYAYDIPDGVPSGLSFDTTGRILSGTPIALTSVFPVSYRVTDSATPTPTSVSLSVNFNVCASGATPAGSSYCLTETYNDLALTSPSNQRYFINQQIVNLILPAATGGTTGGTTERPTSIYSLTSLPSGLSFDPTTRTISGTPDALGNTEVTYKVRDAGSPDSVGRNATTTFQITVTAQNPSISFPVSATIADQTYIVDEVLEITLPEAIDGNGAITYTLSPTISGLNLNPTTRVLSGTPTTPSTSTIYTYTATDGSSNAVSLTFSATVYKLPTAFTISALPTSVRESTSTIPVEFTVTLVGGTFPRDRTFSIGPINTGANSGTASTSDYIILQDSTSTNLIIPTGRESTTITILFSIVIDNIVETETLVFSGTLLTVDGMGYDTTFPSSNTTITINDSESAPVFTNGAAFSAPIEVEENQSVVRADEYFAATGTGTVTYALEGTNSNAFNISDTGTLTFNNSPNFEFPTGGTGNSNDYSLTIRATASSESTEALITIRVTNVNDLPVLNPFILPTFTEYSEDTYTFGATDQDRPPQALSFSLATNTFGATLTSNGVFTWMPREEDGNVARTFTVMVTDNIGTTPTNVSRDFTITAEELPNRAPTGATITGPTAVSDEGTIALVASANDPDTGDVLEYSWSIPTADGGTIAPLTGTNVVYTPPTLIVPTRAITVRVTVSDGALSTTDDHTITVNQAPRSTGFNLAITTPSTSTVTEGGAAQNVTVTATTVPANTIFATPTIINVVVSGTTGATSSADGTNADFTDIDPFTITIPANQTSFSHTFALTTTADTIPEGASIGLSAETITLTGTSGSLPSDTVTLTLLDDDGLSSLDFGGDDSVTSNDGLILYLVASGVNASALAIFVDGPGTTSEKIDRLTALGNRLETDTTLDLGGDDEVTSNDGLILYLVASGVNASALAIFVDGPGTTSEKIDRLAALQTRIETENTGS